MKNRWILPVFVIALTLTSCGSLQTGESQNLPPREPQQVPTEQLNSNPDSPLPQPTQNGSPDFSSAPVNKFVELAKDDLAKNLAINTDQISVLDTKEMNWPNAALGCPAPGEVYAQMQVPGYRIWLNAGGVEYIYHTDLNGRVILCPTLNPDEISTSGSTPAPDIGVPIK